MKVTSSSFTTGILESIDHDKIGVEYAFPVTWVDLHFIVNFGDQQNHRIALNNQTGRYESLILGMASSDSIVYSFTYAKATGAVNSVWLSHLVGD